MSTQFSTDELYQQLQSNQITWLEFMHQSEYSEEYSAWCKETWLSESEESAFLFSEKKDFDSIVAPYFEID